MIEPTKRRISKILEDLGLSKSEARLYRYLIGKSGVTVTQIAKDLNLSRQRVYNLLEELVEKGLVYFSNQKPRIYFPVSPEIAASILIREKERDFYQALKLGEELVSIIRNLHMVKSKTSNVISMEITGRKAIINFLKKFIKDAQKELLIFATRNESIRLVYELKAELNDAKSSGISIMIIAPISQIPEDIVRILGRFAELREGKAQGRIYIRDGESALLMPAGGSLMERMYYDCALLITNKDIAGALRILFLAKFNSS